MSRTRIKFCGMTRAEDAVAAADCGADAVGLVFYRPAPRCVTRERAREILAARYYEEQAEEYEAQARAIGF